MPDALDKPSIGSDLKTNQSLNYFAVVPAAGIGRRMASSIPKQYLPLLNKTVMELTLTKLLAHTQLQTIVVVTSRHDERWQSLDVMKNKRIKVVDGGEQRCHSVLNGLNGLATMAKPNDWVLVHDVARPCITVVDINKLMTRLKDHPVGGILAVPVSDTIKKLNKEGAIEVTVDRTPLWQAQTPQMFRYQLLSNALKEGIKQQCVITDEASALELAGYHPAVVGASQANIKITRPSDLPLAEYYLQQEESLCV